MPISGFTTSELLNKIDPNFLNQATAETKVQDDKEEIIGDNGKTLESEPKDIEESEEPQEDITEQIGKDAEMGEFARQLSKTRVPLGSGVFQLPDTSRSTSFVGLVRQSEALNQRERNLFNTKF